MADSDPEVKAVRIAEGLLNNYVRSILTSRGQKSLLRSKSLLDRLDTVPPPLWAEDKKINEQLRLAWAERKIQPNHDTAERIRRVLARNILRAEDRQPWFSPDLAAAILRREYLADARQRTVADRESRQNTMAKFLFDFMWKLPSRDKAGAPAFMDVDSLIQGLGNNIQDVQEKWKDIQLDRETSEMELLENSRNADIIHLSTLSDVQLGAAICKAVNEGLSDLQRRRWKRQQESTELQQAVERIETLWAGRPVATFVPPQRSLVRQLDDYLLNSKMSRFIEGPPKVVPPRAGLPQNPPVRVGVRIAQPNFVP